MKALSIRAPWWWFILYGGKDIENRDWPTKYRGTLLLHSSKWFNLQDVGADSEAAVRMAHESRKRNSGSGFTFRELRDQGGCIVGQVDLVDSVTESASPWFMGKYGFVLGNPIALRTPIPFKGALGLFEVSDALVERIQADQFPEVRRPLLETASQIARRKK